MAQLDLFSAVPTNIWSAKAEEELIAFMAQQVKDEPDSPIHTKTTPGKKWRLVSAMQKSIRRGQVVNAQRAAHAVLGVDANYLWRRLAVIALEDVGPTGAVACAMTLAATKSKKLREQIGERELLLYIVKALAESDKTRALCDLTCLMEMNQDENRPTFKLLEDSRLWYGWHWDKTAFRKKVMQEQVPYIIQYMAIRGSMVMRDNLWVCVIPVWKAMQSGVNIEVQNVEEPLIHGITASAYDQHCFEGKRAIGYFAKACDDVRRWGADHPDVDLKKALGLLLFAMEGSQVDRLAHFHDSDLVLEQGIENDFQLGSLKDRKEGDELWELVKQNMDKLYYARERVTKD